MPTKNPTQISDQQRVAAEQQIRDLQTDVDYETKEYTVELLVSKYRVGLDDDENELFIPEYQRDFVWKVDRQSKFIESVMLGLPIPYIFTAEVSKDIEDDYGRIEIVDGSQRVRTLDHFVNGDLMLTNLKKATHLNGFTFKDLELSRQRKFARRPVRVIELSDKADAAIRRDIFERINTGSDELKAMEVRKGWLEGPFYDFIAALAQEQLFVELCPISPKRELREEREEMVLRYFAYCDKYQSFVHSVSSFLDSYMKERREDFDERVLRDQFMKMLHFVATHFPYGFRKNSKNASVPRVRFEALSVGTTLALRERPDLAVRPEAIAALLVSRKFRELVVSDGSNSKLRVRGRIEFVRDALLEGSK